MRKTIAVSDDIYNRLIRKAGEIQTQEGKVKTPNDVIIFLFNNQKV
jgi:predicted CopG family antitoxin